MQTEAKPKPAAPLKSPWAQIVRAEPKQKDGVDLNSAELPQATSSSSGPAAANNKQSSVLPSYAQTGLTQRKSTPLKDDKDTAPSSGTEAATPDPQPADSDKHGPSTPALSTSPHPHTSSESSSGTAEKMPEAATAGEATSSKSSEQEVQYAFTLKLTEFSY